MWISSMTSALSLGLPWWLLDPDLLGLCAIHSSQDPLIVAGRPEQAVIISRLPFLPDSSSQLRSRKKTCQTNLLLYFTQETLIPTIAWCSPLLSSSRCVTSSIFLESATSIFSSRWILMCSLSNPQMTQPYDMLMSPSIVCCIPGLIITMRPAFSSCGHHGRSRTFCDQMLLCQFQLWLIASFLKMAAICSSSTSTWPGQYGLCGVSLEKVLCGAKCAIRWSS